MSKHKVNKLSQNSARQHNITGQTPQAPRAGSNQKNQYR